MTATRLAAVGGAFVITLGACGEQAPPQASPEESRRYEAEVVRIQGRFRAAGATLRTALGPDSSPQSTAEALASFQAGVLEAAAALEGLRAPPAVRDPHRRLVAAFRAIARATQPSIDAGRAGNATALRTATERFQAQLNGVLGERANAAALEIDRGLAGP